MHEHAHLLAHGRRHVLLAVTQAHGQDAAEEIQVLASVGVPEPRALAAHERNRLLVVVRGRERELPVLLANLLGIHSANVPRLRKRPRPGRPRNLPPCTISSPRDSTAAGAPTTLRPSYGL